MVVRIEPPHAKPSKDGVPVLGRSAATGRFVLKPASKSGAISLKDAKAAVAELWETKK